MNLAPPAPAPARAPINNLNRANPLLYIVLVLVGVIALAPFVWMLLSSIKSFGDFSFVDFSNLKNIGKSFWPWPPFGDSAPAFNNFAEAMDRIDRSSDYKTLTGIPLFVRQFINTLGISVVTVFGVLTTSALAAYAFAMLEFPGRNILFVIVLITLMIPEELVLVPRVIMMYEPLSAEAAIGQDILISLIPRLGWQNTAMALTIPFMTSAFAIFLLRQYFMQIPKELFDAARIDGAGHMRYLTTMMTPLAKPAIMTVGLLQFIGSWNEFKWTQLVTRTLEQRTLSVSLQNFLQTDGGAEGQLAMAVAVLIVVPIIILYFFTQQYFVEGVAKSGLK
ncbi:MAG TPA: carbohydrate ABC transporter permease [Thermoflexales bacterium]|jgi:ABC-type glycerol-3-phosphate transport system permease component|nr:carbohydrate ABC transporter permease [Anaerolineae bacterium]HQX10681.1 carbohydrate ABC transporter permease [Thermoflexales bacterium]HRA52790.1 carbohydrate ABC transporter permease [Thermoflexales bacterium]